MSPVQPHGLQRVPDKADSFIYHTTLKPCARHCNKNTIEVIGKMHAGSNEDSDEEIF